MSIYLSAVTVLGRVIWLGFWTPQPLKKKLGMTAEFNPRQKNSPQKGACNIMAFHCSQLNFCQQTGAGDSMIVSVDHIIYY